MNRHILLLIYIFTIAITANAQSNLQLTGKIINAVSQEVVAHAHIGIGNQVTVLSNHKGEFQFRGLSSGTLNLDISHVAYQPHKISVDLVKDSIVQIYLIPKFNSLEEVNIEKISPTNQAHTLQADVRIESQGKNLADVLADIAGVNVLRTGNTIAKPMINGLYGNRIILLNQGTRHESQQWGLDHAPEIDPFGHGKISILKNAEALRYGADALAGLIVLEDAPIVQNKSLSGSINMGAHSNGKGGYLNSQIQGRKNHFSYRSGLTALKAGSLRTPDYIIGNTGKNELQGNVLVRYQRQKNDISIYASHFGTELGIFQGAHTATKEDIFARIAHGRPLETYDFSYSILTPKQRVSHQLAKLTYQYQIDDNSKIQTYYSIQQNHRREYDLRRVESDNTPMADMVLTTQQMEAVYQTSNTQVGIFGSTQVNNNTTGTGTTPIIPNFDNHNVAVFASHKVPYGRNYIELGVRYDYKYFDAAGYRFAYDQIAEDGSIPHFLLQDQRNFNNVSAVLGNTWRLTPELLWKSNLSLAWRAPSANELYSDGIHHGTGTYEIGNINLKSEKGLKWVNTFTYSNNWLHLNADIFGQRIADFIYSQPNPDSVRQTIRGTFPIFQYQQDNALFYGVDLQTAMQLNPSWSYDIAFSLVRARNVSQDSYLPYIPAERLQHAVKYQFASETPHTAYIKLKHQYQARQTRYEPNSDFAPPPPSYHTFDAIASSNWRLKAERSLGIVLSVENIFDTAYKDYLDRFRYYSHSIGRNTTLKINYTF
ncbi:iron complex outermembrane receptor protein [Sphingobacterium alimentarium]|uniref:Iron complex outermembrane receptor protein n=1 Tax=Sphingobacterium alimentarium TaxID=797292 RepID=A0A4R3VZH1_9SPHI|nr:TonB-dependent receptor [Sphingobacterium alimentarium]TCV18772.1 iron complex outermembrane receptor protein [Sphingobacterium alimentarium]